MRRGRMLFNISSAYVILDPSSIRTVDICLELEIWMLL